MKTVIILSFMFTIIGCTMKTSGKIISLENAIDLAKREVESRDLWQQKEITCEAKKLKNKFEITVWRIPQTPGGFRTITLSDEGVLLTYIKGK